MSKALSLRSVIVGLNLLCVLILSCGGIFGFYQMTTSHLLEHTLEVNSAYSKKLAKTTEYTFSTMQQNMETLAPEIAKRFYKTDELQQMIDLSLKSNNYYNSAFVADANGQVIVTSPQIGLRGVVLSSIGAKQALKERRFLISEPYMGATGRFIILVSQPLWDQNGTYLGFIGGTIYLEYDNIIKNLLGTHFSKDGSYVFVVDDKGRLIFHPDQQRVGEVVKENTVVQQLLLGKEGTLETTNSRGIKMLTGYSYVPISKWGIVAQTPLADTMEPLYRTLFFLIAYSFPVLILVIVLTIVISNKITQPLKVLADFSDKVIRSDNQNMLKLPDQVSTWYYEAKQLKKASEMMLWVLQERAKQSLTDSLTGLMNRRGADKLIFKWITHAKPFTLAIIDIDEFKSVNDTYGHQKGDEVLQFVTNVLKENVREGDVCCRYGGEEFLVLLPNTSGEEAFALIETIRLRFSIMPNPTGRSITISSGISEYPNTASTAEELFSLADAALYQAKEGGRNRTVLSK
ncbi:sensor domain-containing diguanylate cyclase [Brevibacillus dissolubilis]|uniref:sensor domain-containing diguanylate cyclase n=1 Tax=Brevibacillus dissolubilis TaxID=1844116 RepID=UPI00159BEF3F|nr:sensor domain-containing diguanylate cyclase [Brevibacillus dissolubilis]